MSSSLSRLLHVGLGSGCRGSGCGRAYVARADDDHRDVREGGEGLQPVHDDDAVAARQPHVEQDQVRLLLAYHRDRRDCVKGEGGLVTPGMQANLEQLPRVRVVFDDEDLGQRASRLARPSEGR